MLHTSGVDCGDYMLDLFSIHNADIILIFLLLVRLAIGSDGSFRVSLTFCSAISVKSRFVLCNIFHASVYFSVCICPL